MDSCSFRSIIIKAFACSMQSAIGSSCGRVYIQYNTYYTLQLLYVYNILLLYVYSSVAKAIGYI